MKQRHFFIILLLIPLYLCSIELMKDYLDYDSQHPLSPISNDLVYGDGSTEITAQIDEYENITANKPIQGTIFVTHDEKNKIDNTSFKLGTKHLKVTFTQSSQMASYSTIMVSIYSFQLDGLPMGTHTLPPITVKVGGKEFQALPLVLQVSK